MERYLDELDSLKRQKWIFEKEIKELKETNEKNKERIKKLKDDNLRLNKKVANMQEKERTIDS
jgi:cell division protein FtsB